MKKCFVLVFLLLAVTFASADTLQYLGPNGYTYGGYYMSPYNISVNGTSLPLVCGSATNEVTGGESWNATAYKIGDLPFDLGGLFLGADQAHWNAAGLIAEDLILNHSGDPSSELYQYAVWLAVGRTGGLFPELASDGANLVTAALTSGRTFGGTFWIPDGDLSDPHVPQPFIGTPEPSSLILLGAGLLGFGRKLRRFVA